MILARTANSPVGLRVIAASLSVVLLLVAGGCSDSGSSGPPVPGVTAPEQVEVALGSSVEFSLAVTDPVDASRPWHVRPIEPFPMLPTASFDVASGLVRYRPRADEVGERTFVFRAAPVDGALPPVTIGVLVRVTARPASGPTGLSGTVLDAAAKAPIAGATVRVGGAQVLTDDAGRFVIADVGPAGQGIEVDGTTAGGADPWSVAATGLVQALGHAPYAGQDNVIDRAIYLTRLGAAAGAVDAGAVSTITSAGGVQLVVQAGAASTAAGGFSGPVHLPALDPEYLPLALPDDLRPARAVGILPAALAFDPPAAITLPNLEGFAPGTRLELFGSDPVTGAMRVVGDVEVSGDGERLETVAGGVRAGGVCFALPPAPGRTADNPDQNGQLVDPPSADTVPATGIAVQSGNLAVAHDLQGYRSLTADRRLRLVYNSTAADPRPVVHATTFVPEHAELPTALRATLAFGGVAEIGQAFLAPTRTRVRLARRSDAPVLATGCYPYVVAVEARYPESRRSRRFEGDSLVVNEVGSAFGSGWTLRGLARLHRVPGRAQVVLTAGDGSVRVFAPRLAGVQPVATEIAIVLDGSSSMNNVVAGTGQSRWQLQREGMAQAIESAAGLPRDGSFTISVVQCASTLGAPAARVEVAPTTIDSQQAAVALAAAIRAIDIQTGFSPLADAIDLAADQLSSARPGRQLLLVVCDGDPEDDHLAALAADRAVASGVDAIDVLAVGATAQVARLQAITRAGSLAFAADFTDFAAIAATRLARLAGGVPAGDFTRLTQEPDGGYSRTFLSGRVQQFDPDGRLRADVDRNGNRTEYEYDADGRLALLRGPAGRETRFALGESGLVTGIEHPGGGVTTLAHDGTDLASITDPDGTVRAFGYDASHRLVREVDRRGFETAYEYDADSGRVVRMVDALGQGLGLVASQTLGVVAANAGSPAQPVAGVPEADVDSRVTSKRGHQTIVRTDRFGRVARTRDPLGNVTEYGRDANGLVTSVRSPRGRIDEHRYDASGNLVQRLEAVGIIGLERSTSWRYAPASDRVVSTTDARGETTACDYDASGNLLAVVYPDQSERTFGYDARGLLLASTDENDHTTTYGYDDDGLVETVTDPLQNVTRRTHDARGNVTAIVVGQGTAAQRTLSFGYDQRNRLLSASDGAGGVTSYTYDAAGNLLTATAPTGEVEVRSYDALGRLTTLADPLAGELAFVYDADGNLRRRTDARGGVTVYEYDAVGRRTAITDAALGATGLGYDASGNVVARTDARQNTTAFAYDLLERRTSMTTPLQRTFGRAYDALDHVTQESQPGVGAIVHAYDARGRRESTAVPAVNGVAGNSIAFGYDAVGNLRTVVDDDTAVEFVYDACNRLREERTLAGGVQPVVTVTSSYDAVGNRTTMVDSVGGQHTFGHDGAGRITSVVTPATGTVTCTRDGSGRLLAQSFPNGIGSERSYLANGRPSTVTYTRANGAAVLALTLQWTADGMLDRIDEGGASRTFGYDALARLTGDSQLAPAGYAYDGASNRTRSDLTAATTYNDDDQLLGDDTGSFGYDPRGNVGVFDPVGPDPAQPFRWDAQDQLVEAPGLGAYRYDGLGRLVEKVAAGVVRRYVYDGDDLLLEFDGADQLVARYSHGGDGVGPVAVDRTGVSFYFVTDHRGSVRALTSPGGSEVNRYRYDRFGRFAERTEAIDNPFTFLAGVQVVELDWLLLGDRWYDPATGRYCSERAWAGSGLGGGFDPAGDGAVRPGRSRYAFLPPSVGRRRLAGDRGGRLLLPLQHDQGECAEQRAAGHAGRDQPHEPGR